MSTAFANSAPPNNRPIARFAWFVVFYNILVIVWGALVRASGSGAGCGNRWPLCNGQIIPVSPGFHTIIEFTHRMMVGGSTLLVLALLLWTFRATVKHQAARAFAAASTLLLLNEAFLGALLVKLNYVTGNQSTGRMVLLSIHLGNTLILMAALTLTARLLSTGQRWANLPLTRSLIGVIEGLVTTIFVGISGSIAALGDTLFPAASLHASIAQDFAASSPWLLRLRLVHPALALIAALFALWLAALARRKRSTHTGADASDSGKFNQTVVRAQQASRARLANLLLILLALQFALGVADVVLLAPAWMQLLHLLAADLFWVILVQLAAVTFWPAAAPSARKA
ncbi:MAG: COX15/CtaA family protein [Acidobacteriaceae bacterium]|jgi:cytochrome c oxidase assembly protein subunit 15